MNLKLLSDDQLVSQMNKLVHTERKITHLVLLHINEIERRKIHLDRGYDGMYSYLTRGLGYSDGSAYRRLQAARLLKNVPSLAGKIQDGSINLSQMAQVQKIFREDFKKTAHKDFSQEDLTTEVERLKAKNEVQRKAMDILNKLENKNTFETHKTLAVELNYAPQTHEKLQPQRDESVRFEVTLTAEQFAHLETAKYLLSHICPDGRWADVIGLLAKNFNQKKTTGKTLITKNVLKSIAVS